MSSTIDQQIASFLESPIFGVVGASPKREKYGNKVLRCYLMQGRKAIPVHPAQKEIEGLPCAASVAELPDEVHSISMITPPQATEKVVATAIAKGIKNIWMQPGAESPAAVEACLKAGINVIADGSCLLVVLGYSEH